MDDNTDPHHYNTSVRDHFTWLYFKSQFNAFHLQWNANTNVERITTFHGLAADAKTPYIIKGDYLLR
jgi:hypothetical protein